MDAAVNAGAIYVCTQIRVCSHYTNNDIMSRLWTTWRTTDPYLEQGDGEYHLIVCKPLAGVRNPFVIADIIAHDPAPGSATCPRCSNDAKTWEWHRT